MGKANEDKHVVRERQQVLGKLRETDHVSPKFSYRRLAAQFHGAVTKVLQYLGFLRFCSTTCSSCGRAVPRAQYSKNEVLEVFESIQRNGRIYPVTSPYCQECISRLGIEPYQWI